MTSIKTYPLTDIQPEHTEMYILDWSFSSNNFRVSGIEGVV